MYQHIKKGNEFLKFNIHYVHMIFDMHFNHTELFQSETDRHSSQYGLKMKRIEFVITFKKHTKKLIHLFVSYT